MATGTYDGARNSFSAPQESLAKNADRLGMSQEQYTNYLREFISQYSKNPLFAYQHTDLSDVPVVFDTSEQYPTSDGSYSPAEKRVRITPSTDMDKMMRTLLHELTHAGQDRAGLFTGGEAAQRTALPQGSALSQDRVAKLLSYGPGELAAFIVESMHPATSAGRDYRIGQMIQSKQADASELFRQAAQPTRPVTTHTSPEPQLSNTEKLRQLLFYTFK